MIGLDSVRQCSVWSYLMSHLLHSVAPPQQDAVLSILSEDLHALAQLLWHTLTLVVHGVVKRNNSVFWPSMRLTSSSLKVLCAVLSCCACSALVLCMLCDCQPGRVRQNPLSAFVSQGGPGRDLLSAFVSQAGPGRLPLSAFVSQGGPGRDPLSAFVSQGGPGRDPLSDIHCA